MDIQYSSDGSYPVTKTITLDDVTVSGTAQEAASRLQDFITAQVGYDENGNLNPVEDPFLKDLRSTLTKFAVAQATLDAIAVGSFTSTDNEPMYAGGVVSPGNRIFTPQEAAVNALEQIQRLR